jgi:hypothetical protein
MMIFGEKIFVHYRISLKSNIFYFLIFYYFSFT